VAAGGGGPDLDGWMWTDDEQPGGPAFEWVDTSAGTVLAAGDDESLGPFPLPFPFEFRGVVRDSVRVGTDGFLTFGDPDPAHRNQGIPDPAAPNGLVAPFWTDLDPGLGGEIRLLPGPDRWVVEFDRVPHFGRADVTETFQVELDAAGDIHFRYADVGDGSVCTVGLEDDAGNDGLLVLFNSGDYLRPGRAVRFSRLDPPGWLAVDPATGTVPAGTSRTVVLQLTAPAAAGVHEAFVHLAGNDPAAPVLSVPVRLTVDPGLAPRPRETVFAGAVPNPFNPLTEFRFELPRPMQVELVIHDVSGRRVRTLVAGGMDAGPRSVAWSGRDDTGRRVASGTYFARLRTADRTITRAVTLIR
jgi:hypothetical protein